MKPAGWTSITGKDRASILTGASRIEQAKARSVRSQARLRVGVPRALHFHSFFPYWKALLEELGVEVVVSPPTTPSILEQGCRLACGELCLPMKLYYGHFLELARLQPRLDWIFVPRYVSTRSDGYFCPKFLCLPDVMRIVPDAPPILEWTVNVRARPTLSSVAALARKMGLPAWRAFAACRRAARAREEVESAARNGADYGDLVHSAAAGRAPGALRAPPPTGSVRILLLGHAYNVFDTYANIDLRKKLRSIGAVVRTMENQAPEPKRRRSATHDALNNYWIHAEDLLSAADRIARAGREEADGVVFVSCFACGPDSLVRELILREVKAAGLPTLSLTLDEHTGEGGVMTRVESFVEMIRRRDAASREAAAS